MKRFVRPMCLGVLLVAASTACGSDRDQAQQSGVMPTATIPADVEYTVISTHVIPGIKRSLDVRLSRKVEGDVLRSIAMNLKKDDPNPYERTFIAYYLPDMEVGAGGWATTHFNPELEVNILGLTPKQEESLALEIEDPAREVVGRWLDQGAMVAGRISIYRKDGKLYMERTFKDGSSFDKEMMEEPTSSGRRFEEKGGSSFGEYYVVDQQGNLQVRDQEGLIATAGKIE